MHQWIKREATLIWTSPWNSFQIRTQYETVTPYLEDTKWHSKWRVDKFLFGSPKVCQGPLAISPVHNSNSRLPSVYGDCPPKQKIFAIVSNGIHSFVIRQELTIICQVEKTILDYLLVVISKAPLHNFETSSSIRCWEHFFINSSSHSSLKKTIMKRNCETLWI